MPRVGGERPAVDARNGGGRLVSRREARHGGMGDHADDTDERHRDADESEVTQPRASATVGELELSHAERRAENKEHRALLLALVHEDGRALGRL